MPRINAQLVVYGIVGVVLLLVGLNSIRGEKSEPVAFGSGASAASPEQGGSVAGFPFLASVIAIFSGAQLFALGIIGEYLARMHFRMMDRPTYTVRYQVGSEDRT